MTMEPPYPPLPVLEGDGLLEAFTHKSLRTRPNTHGDNERYVVLGESAFYTALLHCLVARAGMSTRENILAEMRRLCSDEQYEKWVTFYQLREKLRYAPSAHEEVYSPAGGRDIFHAYLGALYAQPSGPMGVNLWVFHLISQPGEPLPQNLQPYVYSQQSQSHMPPSYSTIPVSGIGKVDDATLPPPPPLPPPTHARANTVPSPSFSSFSSSSASSSTSPRSPPSSNTNYIGQLNELAQKRGWGVRFADPESTGPPHKPTWKVTCLLNGSPYGSGNATTKQLAKTEAARQALLALGVLSKNQ